jgi:hypothetical protein
LEKGLCQIEFRKGTGKIPSRVDRDPKACQFFFGLIENNEGEGWNL